MTAAQVGEVVERGAPYVAGATFLTWLFSALPSVAALFSIIWLAMQMIMNWEKFVKAAKRLFTRKGKSED